MHTQAILWSADYSSSTFIYFFKKAYDVGTHLKYSLPSADLRRAGVSLWRKNEHKYWLNNKRTKPSQEKSKKVKKTDWLNMTLMG